MGGLLLKVPELPSRLRLGAMGVLHISAVSITLPAAFLSEIRLTLTILVALAGGMASTFRRFISISATRLERGFVMTALKTARLVPGVIGPYRPLTTRVAPIPFPLGQVWTNEKGWSTVQGTN